MLCITSSFSAERQGFEPFIICLIIKYKFFILLSCAYNAFTSTALSLGEDARSRGLLLCIYPATPCPWVLAS